MLRQRSFSSNVAAIYNNGGGETFSLSLSNPLRAAAEEEEEEEEEGEEEEEEEEEIRHYWTYVGTKAIYWARPGKCPTKTVGGRTW